MPQHQHHQPPPIPINSRPDSPADHSGSGPSASLQHLQLSDTMYNNTFNDQHHPSLTHQDYQELDSQKSPPPQSAKTNGLPSQSSYRSSFASFPNTNRSRGSAANPLSFRDSSATNGFYPNTSAETYQAASSQLTSPTLANMPPYDSRVNYEYAAAANGIASAHKSTFALDPYVNGTAATAVGPKAPPPPQAPAPFQQAYGPTVQIASQTPYGPHIPIVTNHQPSMTNGGQGHPPHQEDISTIFVVGFPDDMQEREFQNMFTFSSGFEAATLKIPAKESVANGYNPTASALRSQAYPNQFGPSDSYNHLIAQQGGVLVDTARDGTLSSWAHGDESHYMGHMHMQGPPRKQIIGFAKFRTREEALIARDVLSQRRVDIEKGAILKAEMAKKNLHTKRGVGPLSGPPPPPSAPGHNGNPANTMQPMPPMQNGGIMNGAGVHLGSDQNALASGAPVDQLAARDRDLIALGKMNHWREPHAGSDSLAFGGLGNGIMREDDDRRRDREASVLHAMGVNSAAPPPPPSARVVRERVEEDWRQEPTTSDMRALRDHNAVAFDAFHSVPPHSAPLAGHRGLDSSLGAPPATSTGPSPRLPHMEAKPSSRRSSSPSSRPYSPLREAEFHTNAGMFTNPFTPVASAPRLQQHGSRSSASSSSGVGPSGRSDGGNGNQIGDATLVATEQDIQRAVGALDLNTATTVEGDSSPQLPSPSSNASSTSMRNLIDQNPPINTLYVGNLPSGPLPPGYHDGHLEQQLRSLFTSCPGFKRLCFRQKSNGPMCFVEFEDVDSATGALNAQYGNTLGGLVKGGGIRLSYSKNPLGVRTPTSAAAQMQHQQPTPHYSGFPHEGYGATSRHYADDSRAGYRASISHGVSSPPPPPHTAGASYGGSYMMSSPPPRFSVPSTASSFGNGPASATTFRGSGGGSYEYGLPSGGPITSSFSPFGLNSSSSSAMIPEHLSHPTTVSEHEHFLHGALSSPPPPHHHHHHHQQQQHQHVEVGRVG
ncbi:hypothetical protein DL96DRAFT_218776 [Flagelloscypha sp. PMI_526]|nr:hypothetical protein DL96DRAFT_218776 [Flagelloscypha sp. PMI_526]